ncbi:hypothetical protein NDU88_000743 [Pleurodeles waltl]|uniref:Uncharacterized protein n=1 Tax=Pleurodeles waltl TaxID=8319 RepID=A0AAV7U4U7_PLEWA|nr:hypothetical protein NDU88_000743 [Pleurodeles waltl]
MLANVSGAIHTRLTISTDALQLELPATSRAKSGTESRFSYPCDERDGVGNPSGRIPEPIQGRQDDADAIGVTGNPDIRVPKGMKRDEGLRAARIPGKEDAGGDAERDGEGNQEEEERTPTEKPKTFSVRDTTTNGEATEGRKLRHVPGGTWLNQLELPATSRAKSGTESRFSYPCDERDGVGNPSGRIPEPLQGRQDDVDAIGVTGNPDIRVPKGMKRDEGLRVTRVPGKEDAGGDMERGGEGNQEEEERTPTEKPKTFSVKDTTTNGEATEGRELRHVPGGTWLNQKKPQTYPYFRSSCFRSIWETHGDYLRLSRGVLEKKKTA